MVRVGTRDGDEQGVGKMEDEVRVYVPLKAVYAVLYRRNDDSRAYSLKGYHHSILIGDPCSKLFKGVKDQLAGEVHVLGYTPLDEKSTIECAAADLRESISGWFRGEVYRWKDYFRAVGVPIHKLWVDTDVGAGIDVLLNELGEKVKGTVFNKSRKKLAELLSDRIQTLEQNWGVVESILNNPNTYTYHEVPEASEIVEYVQELERADKRGFASMDYRKINGELKKAYQRFIEENGLL